MNPADLRQLHEGSLEDREEHLYDLLDRAGSSGEAGRGDGDAESAVAALRTMVRRYPDFHRSLFSRAMNQAAVFGDATLEEPLLAALADTRYNCQAWAAMGCAALGFRAAVPGLLALLDNPQWIAREQALVALGALVDGSDAPAEPAEPAVLADSVVPVLAPLLRDRQDWLRERTAETLSEIGGEAALAALWEEFEQRRFFRIGYLSSALARFTPAVLDRLEAAARSDDPNQRYWSAVALGSTGDERAVPTLERLQATDHGRTVFDGVVSVAAKKALRTLRRIQAAIAARTAPSASGM